MSVWLEWTNDLTVTAGACLLLLAYCFIQYDIPTYPAFRSFSLPSSKKKSEFLQPYGYSHIFVIVRSKTRGSAIGK